MITVGAKTRNADNIGKDAAIDYMQMPEKVKRIDKKVDRLEIKFEKPVEALGRVDNIDADAKRQAEGQEKTWGVHCLMSVIP